MSPKDIKIDFSDVRRGEKVTYFFFPQARANFIGGVLANSMVTGWEIMRLSDARPILPEGIQIPEVHLAKNPEVWRSHEPAAVFISYYDTDDLALKFDALIGSSIERQWYEAVQAESDREETLREAWAKDPSPLDVRRALRNQFDPGDHIAPDDDEDRP